jgi:hypothetical protein
MAVKHSSQKMHQRTLARLIGAMEHIDVTGEISERKILPATKIGERQRVNPHIFQIASFNQ